MAHLRILRAQLRHIAINRSVHFRSETAVRKLARCSFITPQLAIDKTCHRCNTHRTRLGLFHQRRLNGSHSHSNDVDDDRIFNFDSEADDVSGEDQDVASSSSSERQCLYDDHIPTTELQKGLLAVGSAVMSLYDPYRDDMIATLGEVTGHSALRKLHSKMLKDPEGRVILSERPRINTKTVNMDWLASLPEGTLGREYVDFMKKNKITSDTRTSVQFVDDPDLAYVMQRYREIHDFNHALLGMPATMVGEVVVKWFEMINTGLPMTTLGALFGPLGVKRRHLGQLFSVYIPWVIQTAPRAKLLLNVHFEKRWEQPLTELHNDIGMTPFSKER
ncbi:ubiquinone biosynthesis protein COQ4 homolog, mitochondrial-like isoform X1 [Asterias amurensis]|uniref:ubiquinone biosynthesis protein COQ4 homolog, mitochondrial-like isoform X1 n=1 Tax=Asterias amurensis TaxID=7602 RepID=UPI003AB73ACA